MVLEGAAALNGIAAAVAESDGCGQRRQVNAEQIAQPHQRGPEVLIGRQVALGCDDLRAQAGGAQMRLGEVLSLAEGDVVRLGPPGDVSLMAGEHRLHRVKAGVLGSRRAVQIIEGDGAST